MIYKMKRYLIIAVIFIMIIINSCATSPDNETTFTIMQNFPKNWPLWENSMNTLCQVMMNFYDQRENPEAVIRIFDTGYNRWL